jgi:N-acetylglutamate synthase-like GNAT family acetyltransferase
MSATDSASAKHVIEITPLRLWEAHIARRVFADALLNHFDYFEPAYKSKVLAQNSYLHMAMGVLRPSRLLLVAKHEGRIVGYIIGSVPSDKHAQIYWLYVDPMCRGENIGLGLLSRLLKSMAALGATEATLVTHGYTKYYARQGFKLIQKVKQGGVDAYVLTYPLAGDGQ